VCYGTQAVYPSLGLSGLALRQSIYLSVCVVWSSGAPPLPSVPIGPSFRHVAAAPFCPNSRLPNCEGVAGSVGLRTCTVPGRMSTVGQLGGLSIRGFAHPHCQASGLLLGQQGGRGDGGCPSASLSISQSVSMAVEGKVVAVSQSTHQSVSQPARQSRGWWLPIGQSIHQSVSLSHPSVRPGLRSPGPARHSGVQLSVCQSASLATC
jgi:hypothetical protein